MADVTASHRPTLAVDRGNRRAVSQARMLLTTLSTDEIHDLRQSNLTAINEAAPGQGDFTRFLFFGLFLTRYELKARGSDGFC